VSRKIQLSNNLFNWK